jgi:acyl-CoA thioester hydrolase
MSRPPLRPRSAYRHWTAVTARWHDNDAYGHVNNTVYYQWFDTAVNMMLVAAGLLDVDRGSPIALVAETGCRYAAPLSFPQPIEVGLATATLGSSSVVYHLGVFGADAEAAAAEGHFVHICVDRETRRPVPLPRRWREVLERLRGP